MKYCLKSSTDYELLERLLTEISYIDSRTHSLPCTFLWNGKRVRGHIFDDDYRVFVYAVNKKYFYGALEVTRRRNKYQGIQEGMERMGIKFSIPEEYKIYYRKIANIVRNIREARNRFYNEMKTAVVKDITGNEIIDVGTDSCQPWLVDYFYNHQKSPKDLKQTWYYLLYLKKKCWSIPFGNIISKYSQYQYDPNNFGELFKWCASHQPSLNTIL